MEIPASGSPAKEPPKESLKELSRNFFRRKTIFSISMPTLVSLYILGAGIVFMVYTRTFVSFYIPYPESQAPVELPGHESLTVTVPRKTAQEILEELQASIHTLRDVKSVDISTADNSVNASLFNSSGVSFPGEENSAATRDEVNESENSEATIDDEEDENEPEFMHKPILRMNSAKASKLQSMLKRMTSRGRKRWLTEHWSNFQIMKVDNLSLQFQNRMQRFFCLDQKNSVIRGMLQPDGPVVPKSSLEEMDEREICQTNESGSSEAFCRQRFILTWMSPVGSFGPRERLSLESIFKWHPTACVVILSRTLDSPAGSKIFDPFVSRGYRITAVTPDLEALFADIPAAEWFQRLRDGTGDPGSINLMQNLSNLMRLAALYKYGGIYLDTDVIVLQPFDELRNVVGAQSQDDETGKWTRLNNAVLVFDREHPVVLEFLREFVETFDGSRWGWNGPYLVSRVVDKVKQVEHWQNCTSVTVLPRQAFYPVNWINVVRYFERPDTEDHDFEWQAKELQWVQEGSKAIHLWNKKTNFLQVEKGSIMETLFKHSCLFCKPVAGS